MQHVPPATAATAQITGWKPNHTNYKTLVGRLLAGHATRRRISSYAADVDAVALYRECEELAKRFMVEVSAQQLRRTVERAVKFAFDARPRRARFSKRVVMAECRATLPVAVHVLIVKDLMGQQQPHQAVLIMSSPALWLFAADSTGALSRSTTYGGCWMTHLVGDRNFAAAAESAILSLRRAIDDFNVQVAGATDCEAKQAAFRQALMETHGVDTALELLHTFQQHLLLDDGPPPKPSAFMRYLLPSYLSELLSAGEQLSQAEAAEALTPAAITISGQHHELRELRTLLLRSLAVRLNLGGRQVEVLQHLIGGDKHLSDYSRKECLSDTTARHYLHKLRLRLSRTDVYEALGQVAASHDLAVEDLVRMVAGEPTCKMCSSH